MIISLEGSRAAGKTHFKKFILSQKKYVFFPTDVELKKIYEESPDLGTNFTELRKNERWFLDVAIEKMANAKKLNELVFVERDYLSVMAFSYAYSSFSGIDTYSYLSKEIFDLNKNNELIKPDYRIVFDNNYEVFLNRANEVQSKREPIWFDRKFAVPLFDFFRNFREDEKVVSSMLAEINYDPKVVYGKLSEFIKNK